MRREAMNPDETIEALLRQTRYEAAPAVVVDVKLETNRFDRALGRACNCLRVKVIFAAPGPADSRYRERYLDKLPGATPDEVSASMVIVRALAERLGVPVHPPGESPPEPGAPSWLALQGPSPAREWSFMWRVIVWREDGSEVALSGERSVTADNGEKAVAAMGRHIAGQRSPPYRLMLESAELGPQAENEHPRGYPGALPLANTLRAWAVEGRSLAAMLGALAEAPPGPLDRMVALGHAFCVDLRELAPVSAFLANTLSETALEAAVRPVLERTRGQWSLPVRLLEAHAQGRSVGPVLHHFRDRFGLGVLYLIKGMREAFDMSLMSAKSLVDMACSGDRDEELDAAMQAVVASIRAGDRNEREAFHASLEAHDARKNSQDR